MGSSALCCLPHRKWAMEARLCRAGALAPCDSFCPRAVWVAWTWLWSGSAWGKRSGSSPTRIGDFVRSKVLGSPLRRVSFVATFKGRRRQGLICYQGEGGVKIFIISRGQVRVVCFPRAIPRYHQAIIIITIIAALVRQARYPCLSGHGQGLFGGLNNGEVGAEGWGKGDGGCTSGYRGEL